ncbi:MAG: DUF4340 domain-containing protein, partial [Candidatus Cloacimonetes bacterium]|nr:DUF4340 domain-containing protein [Candidatus Cloacimonadota bacterium]
MNKKNILPIIVLVILVVVYVIIRTNDRTEKRVRFFQVDSLQLGFFEIFSGEDSLKLSWEEDQWMIVSPVYFPPADNKIADFFQKILPVGTSSIPISETESALTTYDVADSQGTRVLLYDREGKLQQEAIIGKSSNYNYAYGRNKGNTRVYQLSANITYQLKPTLSPWRKKEIIDIEEEDIAAIHVTYGDTVYTISPTDSLWQYQSGDREFAIPEKNAALLALLNNTRRLRASSFADGEYDTYRE